MSRNALASGLTPITVPETTAVSELEIVQLIPHDSHEFGNLCYQGS